MAKVKVKGDINNYARQACPDCCVCTGGTTNVGRTCVLILLGITVFGLLVLPFFKKCPTCGHNMFMNEHKPKKI